MNYLTTRDIAQLLQRLQADNTSGATTLVELALDILEAFTRQEAAQEHGRVRRVLLSESRPAYDGRPQALALLESGLAVEYSIDMALFERLAEADVVVVGADAVFPDHLINKLGTHALAQLAHLQGI